MSDSFYIKIGDKELGMLPGGMLALMLGLAVAGYGAYDYTQQSAAIENSVEVDATVTGTNVDSIMTSGTTQFNPEVSFKYSYEGERYSSSNLYPASASKNYDTKSGAQSAMKEYEQGETVTAYVNPNSPDDAFLENEESSSPLWFAALGVAFIFGGIYGLFKAFTGR
ncbi:DUF3592 domain-containing protein [Halalkalicoccus jeotgali]|uniref:DUF3592 domain-containing protein n=1 Tax=Halalkalicoccus jeotgali (strain DSM 18796 / CECT 7217 / JCM 14584 / KCTC 4019 / B3) TaxID=795797 RepID=D8JCB7_HALJB|nr:DUF3592 domain-containing protein [Halalkalicoccus jeotgali]ADJ17024.1 hypothetical protein HacjB3_18408 [Halalkalicoccus jeotgali B3]ELY38813.1 hypothetical protein C497_06509 [Halalkalicoccus jeotgali B3]